MLLIKTKGNKFVSLHARNATFRIRNRHGFDTIPPTTHLAVNLSLFNLGNLAPRLRLCLQIVPPQRGGPLCEELGLFRLDNDQIKPISPVGSHQKIHPAIPATKHRTKSACQRRRLTKPTCHEAARKWVQSAPSDRARPHSRGDHLATIVDEHSAHSWHSGRCSGGAPFEQRPAGHYTGPLVMRRPPIRLYYKRRVRYARRSRHFLSHDRGGPENSSASCDARRQMAPRAHAHWRQ